MSLLVQDTWNETNLKRERWLQTESIKLYKIYKNKWGMKTDID